MGMVYQFKVAKKCDVPENVMYEDVYEKFFSVGYEFDREDWLGSFVITRCPLNSGFCKENLEKAIEELKRLDSEVKFILESNEIDLDIDFRRRLAKGLVSSIYMYREGHYTYPKIYYPDTDYRVQNWSDDDWRYYYENPSQSRIIETLSDLLPYANGDYVIWLEAY